MIRRRLALQLPSALLLSACAGLSFQEPLRVQVANLEPLQGEGLELRFLCVLRVQNPNDTPLDFSGISLQLQVRGSDFASGVADLTGTVPRFSEVLLSVPVTASAFNLARLAIGMITDQERRPDVDYHLRGRIGSARFESRGEIPLPLWPGAGTPA